MTGKDEIKTKWGKKAPSCTKGINHKWIGGTETGICLKCGYDVFEGTYKRVKK